MAAFHAFRALMWVAFLAALVPQCLALQCAHSRLLPMSAKQDVYAEESEARIRPDSRAEGEAHGKIKPPKGSEFTSFPVNDPLGDEEMPVFITKDINKTSLEHLFIVLHGRRRDGDHYWKVFNNAIKEAQEDGFPGSDRNLAVMAPQFFSKKYNSGQYSDNQLAWGDLNAWQPGARAIHPNNTALTSYDVLDGLIEYHGDQEKYPNLKNITVIGHGGGGQLAQRYAAVGADPPSHLHVRYIHGDASSAMYFTEDRAVLDWTDVSKESCEDWNKWRYGFQGFPGTACLHQSPEGYFKQYVSRDVVSLVGYEDTGKGGDTSCMANLQGGRNRRTRNLVWYRYIHTLAGSDVDLEGFPGSFPNATDWSDLTDGKCHLRLVVVKNAGHNVRKLMKGDSGRAVLFNDTDLDNGWRAKTDFGD